MRKRSVPWLPTADAVQAGVKGASESGCTKTRGLRVLGELMQKSTLYSNKQRDIGTDMVERIVDLVKDRD